LTDKALAGAVAAERRRLEELATGQAEKVLTAVKTASNPDWIIPPA
jgi:hypothetical protein